MSTPSKNSESVCVDDVIITEELARRPARAPDYEAESRALAAMAQEMARNPSGVLQKVAELVLELCHADSAGISILEPGGEHDIFRWHAAAGGFAVNRNGTIPREASPCGTVMDRNQVLLFNEAERYFPALRNLEPRIYENLLVPWTVNNQPAGTVWAIGHHPDKRFDAEDARLLQSLALFAAAAYQTTSALEEARTMERELEQRVEERTRLLFQSNEALQHEVVQRRQAEAALRESEARLRHVLEIDTVGVMYFNMAGQLIDANNAFLSMSGYRRADLEAGDITWQRMTPPEWMQVSERAIEELNAGRPTTPYEKQYLRKDNSRWWGLFAAKLLNDDTIVEFVVDTTERNEAEQALKEADRRKDQFLATLAHELRNPLAPISNAMHLLKSKEGRRETDPLVEMAQRQVSHVVRLVDDLLEVSRIATGKIEVRKSPVALVNILNSALETSKPLMDSGRHQLHVELPSESLMLDADNIRLAQVFANLLNNAAKYTDAGGEIWLTVRREGKQVVVSVRDNGIGIPPAMLPRIFEMFVQVHRFAGRSQGGLGIGLTMAHSLVELHGGTIEARSEGPNRGSEFIVRLPLLEQPPDAPKDNAGASTASEKPLTGLRILVVDDNHDAADSLAILLRVSGAEVYVTHDGLAALAALDNFEPHAAVIDIGMPGMNGYEVAELIRRHSRYADVRLIALTGWGQEADRSHSHASGFDRHFTKPADFAALEAYLGQQRRQSMA